MINISEILKSFRTINHYSKEDVAEFINISPSEYISYETGTMTPGIDILQKLAILYNLNEPILGVHPQQNMHSSQIKVYSVSEFTKLAPIYSSIPIEKKQLKITESQFNALVNYFRNEDDSKKQLLHDIALSKVNNDGKVYEALTYAWLDSQGIPFTYQPFVKSNECLKKHDYYADGELDKYCIFDIKMFGLSHPNITKLQEKLNSMCKADKPDYLITIDGQLDVSNDILQRLLSKTEDIYNKLFSKKAIRNNDYSYKVENTSLTIHASKIDCKRIIINESEINPYKWAYKNQFYFFHDASQFCRNKPYIIICPYDQKTASHFSNSFHESTNTAFRSLCRRMFFGMPDNTYAQKYDKKCLPEISLKDASKCISAVIFQDVSMSIESDDPTWIYLNPKATFPMPRYLAGLFCLHNNYTLDDFYFDNY